MSFLDKFLDAIKLNDDYDDEDEYLDDEFEDEEPQAKPKKRFFSRSDDEDDFDDEEFEPAPVKKAPEPPRAAAKPEKKETFARKERPAKKPKITPVRSAKRSSGMEVNVIRPSSMEDSRDIADTLLAGCTVVLNLEGVDMDIAQRIIDFTCGTCYSLEGSLQKISTYIYIVTPQNVDISGDFQSILDGNFDIPTIKKSY